MIVELAADGKVSVTVIDSVALISRPLIDALITSVPGVLEAV